MVHSSARRQGLGARLLAEAEELHARGAGGCSCSTRFRAAMPSGCIAATAGSRSGVIPDFARLPDGDPAPTVVFYKRLG